MSAHETPQRTRLTTRLEAYHWDAAPALADLDCIHAAGLAAALDYFAGEVQP